MRLIRLLSNKNSVVNTVKSSVNENRWDIYAGLCLERRPIIAPQLDAFQRVVLQVNQKFETNKSLLSDHEVKKLKEKAQEESEGSIKKSFDVVTAQDIEDKADKDLKEFTYASVRTKSDEDDNKRALDRMLDRRLIFFSHQKLGPRYVWTLPIKKLESHHTSLRQALEELVDQLFTNSNMNVRILSNAPSGTFNFKYGAETAKTMNAQGGQIFLIKAYHLSGNLSKETLASEKINDWSWLTLQESKNIINFRQYKGLKSTQLNENCQSKAFDRITRKIEDEASGKARASQKA